MKAIKNLIKKSPNLESTLKVWYFRYTHILSYFIPDSLYIRLQYFFRTRKLLNLSKPELYNEKIQWMKLNYKNPLLKQCVDKWSVRQYVTNKGLGHILSKAWGPYDSFDQINEDDAPTQFIAKLTNGSGFNLICTDKSDFDFADAKRKFDAWQTVDFFSARREWAYKDVPNRIMLEELLEDEAGGPPKDIRFYCFHGEPKIIAVDLDSLEDGIKTANYKRHLYDVDWNPIEGRIQYPTKTGYKIPKPQNLDELIGIARQLSIEFPAVRVDLYNSSKGIVFGELTFYHASGYQNITPELFHLRLGSYINLDLL